MPLSYNCNLYATVLLEMEYIVSKYTTLFYCDSLLCSYTPVLLYSYTPVLLYSCTHVLIYSCTPVTYMPYTYVYYFGNIHTVTL